MLVYFMPIWIYYIRTSGIFYGHLVIWYIFPRFGILCQQKSGDPDRRLNLITLNCLFTLTCCFTSGSFVRIFYA
jgi:hypothetical protein